MATKKTEQKQKLKNILDEGLLPELNDAERGRVYADFLELYLQTVNDLHRQYAKILDDAISLLKRY